MEGDLQPCSDLTAETGDEKQQCDVDHEGQELRLGHRSVVEFG
jgi:hypothetical protein